MLDTFFSGLAAQAYILINLMMRAVEALPVSYSFGAGMLASVNPCGFIMLPAFAAFYFTAGDVADAPGAVRRARRALEMAGLITLAFVATFGLAGAVISVGGRFVLSGIGWAALAIGGALVIVGIYQLATRRSLFTNATMGVRVQRSATLRGVVLFGMAYALASLSCTLPIFLTVVGVALTDTGGLFQSLRNFLEYAAGMGAILTMVTLGIALFRHQTVRFVNRALPYVEATSNLFLILAGSYLVWYWIVKGGLL